MIDTKTTEKYANRRVSDVAREFAEKHGLTPEITETEGLAGTLYDQDTADLRTERTEWDILSALARESGMLVRVQGRKLILAPRPEPGGDSVAVPRFDQRFGGASTFVLP